MMNIHKNSTLSFPGCQTLLTAIVHIQNEKTGHQRGWLLHWGPVMGFIITSPEYASRGRKKLATFGGKLSHGLDSALPACVCF